MMLGDITNPDELNDWWYILLAIFVVDIFVLFFVRYLPDTFGEPLNTWYERFGLSAVLSDVSVIAIGFFITRYLYTYFMPEEYGFHLLAFLGILVSVQVIHDILFYYLIVKPIPKNHNRMIDIFKRYSDGDGGYKILLGDAGLVVGSAFLAMLLKQGGNEVFVGTALASAYTLPYILETKNKYSEF